MAVCTKCGEQIEEGATNCPACGEPIILEERVEAQTENAEAKAESGEEKSKFKSKIEGLNNTADTSSDYEKEDAEKNKTMCILAYLSWLVLIPLFAAKDSKFARYHTNQGLALAIIEIAWWIIVAILDAILLATIGMSAFWLYSLIITILRLVNVLFAILAVVGIMNAVNGRAKELPLVGKIKILK